MIFEGLNRSLSRAWSRVFSSSSRCSVRKSAAALFLSGRIGERFEAIVEQRNASETQLQIDEVYPSYAIFDVVDLLDMLEELPRDSVSGEYYLTDVPAMMRSCGKRVELVPGVPAEDILSINTPEQLAQVDAILQQRLHLEAAT